ncbi:glycosyltransferase family 2 protein [Rhodanobacter glycinis]|nr:glycosyltransferase family 2 protein [Rhodanobacter glycinis]
MSHLDFGEFEPYRVVKKRGRCCIPYGSDQTMSIKLSICIATRNRGEFIGETLESIAAQCTSSVEIVVLDGASSDNTEQVVRALQNAVPALRYFRQEKNGGVDRDYDAVVGLALGEYCWLMSDDDLLMPGAVDAVMRAIERNYSLIVVNTEIRNLDFSQLIDGNRLSFFEDRIYPPSQLEALFEQVSGHLGYIGAVVIRRDLWGARTREQYYGSYFIHVGVIFQWPLPNDTLVISQPLVSIRFGNTQWRPKEFEIRMIRWTELVSSLSSISPEVRARCYRSEPWRSIKSLMFYRAKGTYDLGDYQRWVKPRLASRWDRSKAYAVACFPGPLANLIGLIYCSFKYHDSTIHYLDMKASRFFIRNWFRQA